jgi:hypothetical protein
MQATNILVVFNAGFSGLIVAKHRKDIMGLPKAHARLVAKLVCSLLL